MKVFSQKGEVIPFHNGTGSTITSGTVVKQGSRVGVVTGDILASGDGEILLVGVVYGVPSDTGTAWTDGDTLYWDPTNLYFTKTKTTGNAPAGTAVGAKLSASATATVRLQQTVFALAAVVAANATAAATDLATSEALANSLQTTVNNILTALKNAGLMATA